MWFSTNLGLSWKVVKEERMFKKIDLNGRREAVHESYLVFENSEEWNEWMDAERKSSISTVLP